MRLDTEWLPLKSKIWTSQLVTKVWNHLFHRPTMRTSMSLSSPYHIYQVWLDHSVFQRPSERDEVLPTCNFIHGCRRDQRNIGAKKTFEGTSFVEVRNYRDIRLQWHRFQWQFAYIETFGKYHAPKRVTLSKCLCFEYWRTGVRVRVYCLNMQKELDDISNCIFFSVETRGSQWCIWTLGHHTA